MTCQVSLNLLITAMLEEERVQDPNEVFLLVFVETSLDVNEIIDSGASLFEYSVN